MSKHEVMTPMLVVTVPGLPQYDKRLEYALSIAYIYDMKHSMRIAILEHLNVSNLVQNFSPIVFI